DGKTMSPAARLKCYVDPQTKLPVLLGRAYLSQRLASAQGGQKSAERWAYMPWNWPNIVAEIPRGILKTPVEVVTGRDPNQEGYIGRVYMNRGEGGDTVHRNALGQIVHAGDILELMPDRVDRYLDPSQFPKQ